MVQTLYAEFLTNDAEYQAVEVFWRNLFERIAADAGQSTEWSPWRPRAYANGTPFARDGNPVFAGLNPRLRRALQIIQWPPERDEIEIAAWISELATDGQADEPFPSRS